MGSDSVNCETLEQGAPARNVGGSVTIFRSLAYAAPVAGSWFFYIPMWSILPAIYAKYFGLSLTSIAAVVFSIRLFDGVVDTATGYLSDWHRERGGSRRSWVVVGCVGTAISCYYLFIPPLPATTGYYLAWSIAFFLMFTIAEIPHMTWGSELTMGYQQRASVFGVRNMMCRVGIVTFYSLPLLPFYSSTEYTPQVLRDAVYVGAAMTIVALAIAIVAAPAGSASAMSRDDSLRQLLQSITRNRPLLIYFASFASIGLAGGMWFGLVYFYLDTYLHLGDRVAMMFLVGYAIGALCTPICLKVVNLTSKAAAWAFGIVIYIVQLVSWPFVAPNTAAWVSFTLIALANVCFCFHDVAALATLGDIADYGKLKFKKDRGATYFAMNILLFKFGLGIGGGVALWTCGLFGFDPSRNVQSDTAIFGLKLAFSVLPTILATLSLVFITLTPLNRRRHGIIQRRIEKHRWRRLPP